MAFHRQISELTCTVLLLGVFVARAEMLERLTAEALRNNVELRVVVSRGDQAGTGDYSRGVTR